MAINISMSELEQVVYRGEDVKTFDVGVCKWRKPYRLRFPRAGHGVASYNISRVATESNCQPFATIETPQSAGECKVYYGDTLQVSAVPGPGFNVSASLSRSVCIGDIDVALEVTTTAVKGDTMKMTVAADSEGNIRLTITAGANGATATFGGVSKTVSAGASAAVIFNVTNDTLPITSGEMEIAGATSVVPTAYEISKNETAQWVGITGITQWDKNWTEVPARLFYQQTTLTGLIPIPSDFTSVGEYAFYDCSAAIPVVPSEVTSVGKYAFYQTLIDGYDETTMIGIGDYAFAGTKLTKVILKENCTYGTGAFERCGELLSADIAETTVIPFRMFYECTKLEISNESLEHLVDIGGYAFANTLISGRLYLPQAVNVGGFNKTAITAADLPVATNVNSFSGCTALTSCSFPKAVTLGDYLFKNCTSLTQVDLPDSVTSIGSNTFYGCTGLTTFPELPPNVKEYPRYYCYGCTKLPTILLPDNLTKIGEYAFYGCSAAHAEFATKILPEVGDYAFTDTNVSFGLLIIKGSTGVCAFKNAGTIDFLTCEGEIEARSFENKTTLKVLGLDDNVTAIWGEAFSGCSSLSGAVYFDSTGKSISNGPTLYMGKVSEVGSQAFAGTGFKSLKFVSPCKVYYDSFGAMDEITFSEAAECTGDVAWAIRSGVRTVVYTNTDITKYTLGNLLRPVNFKNFGECPSILVPELIYDAAAADTNDTNDTDVQNGSIDYWGTQTDLLFYAYKHNKLGIF